MLLAIALFAQTTSTPVASLEEYIKMDTGQASWTLGPRTSEYQELRLNGLKWQGDVWRHEIVIAGSKIESDTAILNLTGDRMENTMDDFTVMFSNECQLPVATVYGIPNQPFLDKREDELVGHGIMQFFMTADDTWPLYLPMTKSAIHAMDAVQEYSKGRINKFIITGTSKRGATSWLVASINDPRVVGIVPVVADINVDMTRQLEYEKSVWGYYSPMFPEFKTMDPVPFFKMPRGRQLFNLVDPYFALKRVKVPTLVITASNDVFSVVDNAKLYWDEVSTPKLYKVIPNATHFFAIPNAPVEGYSKEQSLDMMRSIRFFADCLSGKDKAGIPDINNVQDPRRVGSQEWSVESDQPWLSDSVWTKGGVSADAKNSASFTVITYQASGYKASFSSLVTMKVTQPVAP